MTGRIAALYRHPVKGFTPEARSAALLEAGAYFPCDRLFAVENGPCGFDPASPSHVPKTKFTVLASIPALARIRTAYDEASGVLEAAVADGPAHRFALHGEAGREAFAAWLTGFVDPEDRRGALKVLRTGGAHRFTDNKAGAVSILNLASIRDLEARIGRPVDPLRFRANVHVDGWPPWCELDFAEGAEIALAGTTLRVVKQIVRCVATHVDPATGERDIDVVPKLFEHYGRPTCGIYAQVAWGGEVRVGDPAEAAAPSFPPLGEAERTPLHVG